MIRLFAAALIAIAAGATSARALTFELVPGTTIEMSQPAGLCNVDRNGTPAERNWFGQMESLQKGVNKLLSFQASCPAVEAIREGRPNPSELKRWVIVVTPSNSAARDFAESRDSFIVRIGNQLPTSKGQDSMASGMKTASERIKAAFGDGSLQMENLGELARDDNALYLGMAMAANVGGQQHRIAAVASITLIKGSMVNVNLYKYYVEPTDYDVLVQEARVVLADFVSRNEASNWSARASDWERLRNTLLIGLIGVACCAAFWFIKRRQKKPKQPLG